jgi:hypothetical protein
MGVVHLRDEVCDRKLKAVREPAQLIVTGNQPELRAEIELDVGDVGETMSLPSFRNGGANGALGSVPDLMNCIISPVPRSGSLATSI